MRINEKITDDQNKWFVEGITELSFPERTDEGRGKGEVMHRDVPECSRTFYVKQTVINGLPVSLFKVVIFNSLCA